MGYTVLVVDDSRIIRSVVKKAIDMSGLEVSKVFEAGNGAEALQVLAEQWIDIVFADLNMPTMSGDEMVEKMSEDSMLVSVPVVIISSERNKERIEALKKRGIRAYMKKPFKPEEFKEVVSEVLG